MSDTCRGPAWRVEIMPRVHLGEFTSYTSRGSASQGAIESGVHFGEFMSDTC